MAGVENERKTANGEIEPGPELKKVIAKIKKVIAKTIGLDLVEVKPMNVPTGTLYYIDFKYKNE